MIHQTVPDQNGNLRLVVRSNHRSGNVAVNVQALEEFERLAHKHPGKRLLVDGANTRSGARFLESPDWVREAGDLKGTFYLLDQQAISEVQIIP